MIGIAVFCGTPKQRPQQLKLGKLHKCRAIATAKSATSESSVLFMMHFRLVLSLAIALSLVSAQDSQGAAPYAPVIIPCPANLTVRRASDVRSARELKNRHF
jgi:hypothetical protein